MNKLVAGVEHEEARPIRLHYILKPLAQYLPAALPVTGILVGRRAVNALEGMSVPCMHPGRWVSRTGGFRKEVNMLKSVILPL